MRVRVEVVVRAHDRRVAARVAAAEIALPQHGHVGESVLLREIVGCREPMPTAAHDDDVVAPLRPRTLPCERPALVVRKRIAGERDDRILHAGPGRWMTGETLSLARRIAYSSDSGERRPFQAWMKIRDSPFRGGLHENQQSARL